MAEFFAKRGVSITSLAAAATLALAACGASSTPHVASLRTTSDRTKADGTPTANRGGGSSATKPANRAPTRLVDEWAACERRHGDVNQPDPTIDAHGVINVTIPFRSSGGMPVGDPHDVSGTCSRYLAAAQSALRAADPVQDPLGMQNQADLLKYVACMRANGIPNYPYPSGPNDSETNFNGTGVDPTAPSVIRASIKCGNELHLPLWWSAGWGPPETSRLA